MNRKISPSLLSANFTRLKQDIELVEKLGVDRLHLDVMDGHFVPNLTFGPFIISQIREITNLHLETHLMIENPSNYIKKFKECGADILTVHYEACKHLHRTIEEIKEAYEWQQRKNHPRWQLPKKSLHQLCGWQGSGETALQQLRARNAEPGLGW